MKFGTFLLPLISLAALAVAAPSTTSSSSSNKKQTPTKSAPELSRARLTNAERLRQGLPVKRPSVRALSHHVRAPAPSVTPCGRLFLLASDGGYDGYVSAALDTEGRYQVVQDPALALEVVYSNHRLIPTNVNNGLFFGATFGVPTIDTQDPGFNNFQGNSGNFAVMSGTQDTPYNAPPQQGTTTYTTGRNNGIEAAIFNVDYIENNEVLPTWINTDGSPHLSFFGIADEGLSRPLVISQNIGSYNDIYGGYSARMFCEPN